MLLFFYSGGKRLVLLNMKKRIPKNYDGPLPTGRMLQQFLPQLIAELSNKIKDQPEQIIAAWIEIVGQRIGRLSFAEKFEEGTLWVRVQNTTLNSLLIEHEKPRLIAAFQKKFPKVQFRDIVFRIG